MTFDEQLRRLMGTAMLTVLSAGIAGNAIGQNATTQNPAAQNPAAQNPAAQNASTPSPTAVPAVTDAGTSPPQSSPVTRPSESLLTTTRLPNTSAIAQMLRSRSRAQLVRVPEMLGDFGIPGNQFVFFDSTGPGVDAIGNVAAPVASGLNRMKVAEFNKAMPSDRIYATYHHYHNTGDAFVIVESTLANPDAVDIRNVSVNRWVLGTERTFESGRSSIELRVPLGIADEINVSSDPLPLSQVATDASVLGNVGFILKRIANAGHHHVVSYGLGIETPTGEDGVLFAGSSLYEFGNDTVHLSPFLSMTARSCDGDWFTHGFAQIDTPLGGNDVTITDRVNGGSTLAGVLNDPTRLLLDTGVGRWLRQPHCNQFGIAAIGELHLMTNLSSTDQLAITRSGAFGPVTAASLPPVGTVLNTTLGVHLENSAGWHARFATSAPLTTGQLFDTEIQVQIGRRF
ncbi:hypothetical protein [Stieleria varia]|uniref:Uncharacterized protein n=1 Tax=Stieleria varia TaxID=2528005 RepID=A0A5C5ZXU1_9BACT|nr:hypothetical protein [Stieleria varia]TWT91966.1 hypothetical protein Pla52n_64390 [Stieleria varia]